MDNQEIAVEKEIAVKKLSRKLKQLGLTTTEYAIAGGVIAVAVIGLFATLGGQIQTRIQAIVSAL